MSKLNLFQPLKIGALNLKNRIVMAPLTRCRASEGRVPNALMAKYYGQRASAGMIISEATSVMPQGVGYPDTPGLWSEPQVEGWRLATDAVHKAGGLLLSQLWHVGRISDPSYLNGDLPVAPSAIPAEGHVSLLRPKKAFVTPRALTVSEIAETVAAYHTAAVNAKKAGFDGVEIHGANGYLPDQFLRTGSNRRTDSYGGPVENRARFQFEIIDEAISVWGADRVGLHISPSFEFPSGAANIIEDADPLATFTYVVREASRRNLAFICSREKQGVRWLSGEIRKEFSGAFIVNESFTKETAERAVANGEADAVAFGKWFISNPDLPERFAANAALNEFETETFYASDHKGYVDYPSLAEDVSQA